MEYDQGFAPITSFYDVHFFIVNNGQWTGPELTECVEIMKRKRYALVILDMIQVQKVKWCVEQTSVKDLSSRTCLVGTIG